MDTIVVATDGSAAGLRALAEAIQLARALDRRLLPLLLERRRARPVSRLGPLGRPDPPAARRDAGARDRPREPRRRGRTPGGERFVGSRSAGPEPLRCAAPAPGRFLLWVMSFLALIAQIQAAAGGRR